MSDLYMTIEGLPGPRPARARLLDGGALVGCAHWTDQQLADLAGVFPVVDFDPSTHTATGGGELVEGGIAPNVEAIPSEVLRARSVERVVAERARRMALGFFYDFGDARGVVRIGTDAADLAGWSEVTTLSNALIALGQGSAEIEIYPDAVPVTVTALEWQSILVASGQFRQPIWLASFVLQSMDPIPADVTNDAYWPSAV